MFMINFEAIAIIVESKWFFARSANRIGSIINAFVYLYYYYEQKSKKQLYFYFIRYARMCDTDIHRNKCVMACVQVKK